MFRTIIIMYFIFALSIDGYSQYSKRSKMLRDSTIKYGVEIGPYLESLSPDNRIVPNFNYSPYINKFLRKHKYVKFPAYTITIGIDSSLKNRNRNHLKINSGNRLFFPKGSLLKCPSKLKTNGYMIFTDGTVKDVFIDGINLEGSKSNVGYITSEYGAGITLYAPTNITILNATITNSSGDGIAVRTNYGKQSEDIIVNGLKIKNATRVGFLVTGVINGQFNNIYIEETGEKIKSKIIKPQTAVSFEPNDCTSKYVNCTFNNLETKNNYGPVMATANFSSLFTDQKCGSNKVSIEINNWKDIINDPACYGATLDISTFNLNVISPLYKTDRISGEFRINNPTFVRNTKNNTLNRYFLKGNEENLEAGIKYSLKNPKLIIGEKTYDKSSSAKDATINNILKSSKKLTIK